MQVIGGALPFLEMQAIVIHLDDINMTMIELVFSHPEYVKGFSFLILIGKTILFF